MMRYLLLSLITLFTAQLLHAEEPESAAYQIQLGSYADPQYKYFDDLHDVGYVFALPQPSGMHQVRMGTYSSYRNATRQLSRIKRAGFDDAFVLKIPIKKEDAVYIVQMATYDQTDEIYWADWQRIAPNLCAQLSDTKIRVASGPFYSREEAEIILEKIRYQGPKDVFIRKVSSKVIHKVTDFEMQQSGLYEDQKGIKRYSVQALQKFMTEQRVFFGKHDGYLGKNTRSGIEQFQQVNDKYRQYVLIAQNTQMGPTVEPYTLQYYINMINEDPQQAMTGLKEFKHPIAKVFRAYLHLNGDVPIADRSTVVNRLMNMAIDQVFTNYRGETRYDFSLNYAYEDMEQLLLHFRAIEEVVKDAPAVPCWLFERHPNEMAKAFAPYWNDKRDQYSISSSCGTVFEVPGMKVLMVIANDFAKGRTPGMARLPELNKLYLSPIALSRTEMRNLESWNGRLWKSLKTWADASPLQEKTYVALRFAYYHAFINLENYFLQKGFSGLDARSLALKVLRYSAGCALDQYCDKK